jgi:hypothetical protein
MPSMLLTLARFCCGPSWKSARPRELFESGLRKTVEWYLSNRSWWERIRAKGYACVTGASSPSARVCCQSLSATGIGSMLSLRHYAASSPERCSSRWWTLQTGTMNSSLTRRPSARGLGKRQVMRIGWHTAAHKARLPQHEFPVVLIAQANRLTQSMGHVLAGLLLGWPRSFVAGTDIRPADGHCTLLREPLPSKISRHAQVWRCRRNLLTGVTNLYCANSCACNMACYCYR